MSDQDSTPGKAPAFQFYSKDFLSDSNVVGMSMQERGVYITLICLCWQDGSLPADIGQLARRCATPLRAFQKLWPAVEKCFRKSGASRLVHPRLEKERQKQADYRQRQHDASRKRWDKPKLSHGIPKDTSAAAIPQASSAICYLQSADFSQERDPAREKPSSDAVHAFMESYRELHERYIGIAYLGNPQTDYREACTLVAAFDAEMLEKLTVYWLNDGDKFARDGTRTIAKFRSRASKYAEELKAKKLA